MPTEDELLQQEIERARQRVPAAVLPTLARGSPDDGTRPGWLGLLGEGLGGGQGAGYQLRGQEEDAAGSRALLNFGIQTLLASGPSSRRPDILGSVAHGLLGAQQSIGVDQRRGQARAESEYSGQVDRAKLAQMQSHSEVERLRTLIPLLELQDKRKEAERIRNLPPPWGPSASTGQPGQQTSAVTPLVRPNLPEGVSPAEDQAVLTVWGEAEGETLEGQRAVAAVIRNRMKDGKSVGDVVFAPGQFEPWSNPKRRGQMVALSPSDPQYQAILNGAVRPILRGEAPDPTGGATSFYSPTAQAALKRETPGFAVGREPTKVIGRHNFYTDGSAPTAVTPRRPPMPPAADVAPTGAVVAGPGAQPGAVQPPSPEVAGNVAAMVQGMIGAGADPTTLAPGRGGGPAGPQVAQAGQPGVTPPGAFATPLPDESFDAYLRRNQIPLSPDDQRHLAGIQAAKRAAMSAWQAASTQEGKAKASAEYAAAEKAEGEAVGKIGSGNREMLFKIWDSANTAHRRVQDEIAKEGRAAAAEQAKAAADFERQKELEIVRAQQARITATDVADNTYTIEERKRFGVEQDAARDSLDNAEMLRRLSAKADTSTPLDNIVVGNRTARDYMVSLGMGTEAQRDKWGAQQAFNAAVKQTVLGLKKGISMGSMTDRDLTFLEEQAPNLLQDPRTRDQIISLIQHMPHRKLNYINLTEELFGGGKNGIKWSEAKREALKQMPASDSIPRIPMELRGNSEGKLQWLRENGWSGMIVRDEDGNLGSWTDPKLKQRR